MLSAGIFFFSASSVFRALLFSLICPAIREDRFCEGALLEYFEDGSHLTDLGRKIYSEYLAEHIYDYYCGQDDDLE